MTCDGAVTDDVDGALPATSRNVVAATNWNEPARGVPDWAPQEPVQPPVTVNVTVRLPLLSARAPANAMVRVELLLERYPVEPVVRSPFVSPLIPYDVLLRARESVSVAVLGTVDGSRASWNVTLNVSGSGFALTLPFLFVATRLLPDVVGPLVSYVNVRALFSDRLPAASTVHATTWYETPFVSWLVDSGVLHVVDPEAVTDVFAVCQPLPVQCRPSLRRRTVTRTLPTPAGPSLAVPQIRDVGEHPDDQVEDRYRPPSTGNVIAFVGAVVSMRIVVPAVRTASVLPDASTEKYRIVYVPDAASATDVPCADAMVGMEPSVV
jgi:hypothetical protein